MVAIDVRGLDVPRDVAFVGAVNPRDYVFAVFDDAGELARAVEGLYRAGFDEADIVVVSSADDLLGKAGGEPQRRFLVALFAALHALHDPGAFQERYLAWMRDGHLMMHVYAPDSRRFERALSVLETYAARAV